MTSDIPPLTPVACLPAQLRSELDTLAVRLHAEGRDPAHDLSAALSARLRGESW